MEYRTAFDQATRKAGDYGLVVAIVDVVDPNTGDLDGKNIQVDYAQSDEDRLFLLAHLFGHCVQWNTSAGAREIGQAAYVPTTPDQFRAVQEYEKDASRYGLQLMHEAGVRELDRWLTDLWHADWLYLAHYYRTGEKKDPRSFLGGDPHPVLTPLAIPVFTPRIWPSRFAI
jgi:hypothetical protein